MSRSLSCFFIILYTDQKCIILHLECTFNLDGVKYLSIFLYFTGWPSWQPDKTEHLSYRCSLLLWSGMTMKHFCKHFRFIHHVSINLSEHLPTWLQENNDARSILKMTNHYSKIEVVLTYFTKQYFIYLIMASISTNKCDLNMLT